jgi:MFS family permease
MLAAACLGMLALGVNGTAIMAALPTIRRELGLSSAELEWAINAYLIVSAACIVPGGKAGDHLGARRVAVLGLALFAVASVVVVMADAAVMLLTGRALQGLAAALAVPATLSAISDSSAPERRASAIGAWAGFLMLGFSLGPLIGGALTHYLDWRVIFWLSAACMLAATIGFIAPRAPHAALRARRVGRPDMVGFALLALFMIALISALHALPMVVTQPLNFAGFGALAAAAFVCLLATERGASDPLLDLSLFRELGFVRAVALGSIAMSCILALLLFYNLDAQSLAGLAMTPVGAGLSLLPMSAGLLIFAFSAPALDHRLGPRLTLFGGNLLIAVAAVAVAVSAQERMWLPLLLGLFAIGAGLALPYATAPRLALATLPSDRAGVGSGIINACTFLGGSIGVAAGAVAFTLGGLSAAMAMIALFALVGAWLSRGLPSVA